MSNFLDHSILFDEYITGNRFIDICQVNGVTFCKTDFIGEFTNTSAPVFVTHNSDYHITWPRWKTKPQDLKTWYCQNKDYTNRKLVSLPIGLENMIPRISKASQEGRFSSAHGTDKPIHINELALDNIRHNNLVYLNFNVDTYPTERQFLYSSLGKEPWVTTKANVNWKEYYSDIVSHKFVVSPRGNGVDCHRTWEALYLRTIPIVRRSTHMEEFKDLPILYISDWREVTEKFLMDSYDEMAARHYNLSKMKLSYWKERIKNE